MTREELIADAKAGIKEAAAGIEKSAALSDVWNNLDEGTRNALTSALIGGTIGGATLGAGGAMTAGEDESAVANALKYGLIGALGGGVAGGAGRAGYDLLTQGRQLPGEVETAKNPVDAATDVLTGTVLKNPLTTAGGTLGAYGLAKHISNAPDVMTSNLGSGEKAKLDKLVKSVVDKWGKGMVVTEVPGKKGPKGVVGARATGWGPMDILRRAREQAKAMLPGREARALKHLERLGVQPLGKKGLKPAGKLGLLALPAGLAIGYAGDRLLRGEND